MKCYCASFNVGNVEVWSSELYLEKESIFTEIEKSKEEIAERIECFSINKDRKTIYKILKYAILDLKEFEMYENKEYNFDFFIIERLVLENYKQKQRNNYGIYTLSKRKNIY